VKAKQLGVRGNRRAPVLHGLGSGSQLLALREVDPAHTEQLTVTLSHGQHVGAVHEGQATTERVLVRIELCVRAATEVDHAREMSPGCGARRVDESKRPVLGQLHQSGLDVCHQLAGACLIVRGAHDVLLNTRAGHTTASEHALGDASKPGGVVASMQDGEAHQIGPELLTSSWYSDANEASEPRGLLQLLRELEALLAEAVLVRDRLA
jgi:hypothetical protein